MTQQSSRRTFLATTGAAGALALAGCMGGGNGGKNTSERGGSRDTPEKRASQGSAGPLTVDGSSTVYPITSQGAAVWNSNPPASDEEYWGPGGYGIDTDEPMADYWAGLYGFESEEGRPPFRVNVGLSHSGTGIEKLMNGQIDIGDSSAPVEDELPEADQSTLEKFVDHVVARDGQPIVVSKEIYEAGVTKLTGDQVRRIYRGEIANWSEIPAYNGPDKEIQAVGRSVGSGTDTAFRANLLGDPNAPMPGIDVRKGQNQQVQTLVARSDNTIAYMALAFVDEDRVPAIALEIDGTTYEYGKNLGSKDYPLSRDLHCYTWKGTSKLESAFIRMLLSEYGQQNFVQPNDYFMIPKEEREAELAKLAKPTN